MFRSEFCSSPIPVPVQRQKGTMTGPRVPRVIKVGTDFSGMEMPLIALQKNNINYQHRFACDSAGPCRDYIREMTKPEVLYKSVVGRDVSSMPEVDMYVFSPPCQPFSMAGKGQGELDHKNRGRLVQHSLLYIKRKRPRLAIMENVSTLAGVHIAILLKIQSSMKRMGYTTFTRVVNTSQYGVPQNRKRVYLVAIRSDSMKRGFAWPKDVGLKYKAKNVVIEGSRDNSKRLPDKGTAARKLVKLAYRRALSAKINPGKTLVAVDTGCTEAFANSSSGDILPCITASRGKHFGWRFSTVGRRPTIPELLKWQGVEIEDVKGWEESGICASSFGHMIGNSMSLNVIERVMIAGMWASGLLARRPVDRWA